MPRFGLLYSAAKIALGIKVERTRPKRSIYPELLYKYYPPERLDIFEAASVRFSQFKALNDPLEFGMTVSDKTITAATRQMETIIYTLINSYIIFRLPALIASRVRSNPEYKRLNMVTRLVAFPVVFLAFVSTTYARVQASRPAAISELREKLSDLVRKDIFDSGVLIFSCSNNGNSIPMWAHYAATHTGFQIAFDPASIFTLPDNKGNPGAVYPLRVKYFDKLPVIDGGLKRLGHIVLCKLKDWSYEREWRFIARSDQLLETKYRDARNIPVFTAPLNLSSIMEVTFGCLSTDQLIANVRSACDRLSVEVKFFRVGSDGVRHRIDIPTTMAALPEV